MAGFSRLEKLTQASYELQPVMTECEAETESSDIFVDIGGAVAKPGMYRLAAGSRLAEGIELAGGFAEDADSGYIASSLNSANHLKDGDKVFIPSLEDSLAAASSGQKTESSADTGAPGLISINSAGAKELQTLPQIGEKRAGDIVAGRPYQSVGELLDSGIVTQKIFDEIEELISL